MSAPVCLIENDENGQMCVRKEAKVILDGINEPVVVVSVVGLYRTGKSYLMNRLAGQQSGEKSIYHERCRYDDEDRTNECVCIEVSENTNYVKSRAFYEKNNTNNIKKAIEQYNKTRIMDE